MGWVKIQKVVADHHHTSLKELLAEQVKSWRKPSHLKIEFWTALQVSRYMPWPHQLSHWALTVSVCIWNYIALCKISWFDTLSPIKVSQNWLIQTTRKVHSFEIGDKYGLVNGGRYQWFGGGNIYLYVGGLVGGSVGTGSIGPTVESRGAATQDRGSIPPSAFTLPPFSKRRPTTQDTEHRTQDIGHRT